MNQVLELRGMAYYYRVAKLYLSLEKEYLVHRHEFLRTDIPLWLPPTGLLCYPHFQPSQFQNNLHGSHLEIPKRHWLVRTQNW